MFEKILNVIEKILKITYKIFVVIFCIMITLIIMVTNIVAWLIGEYIFAIVLGIASVVLFACIWRSASSDMINY